MIGYIEGSLIGKEEDRILLLVNQIGYEILLPAGVMASLQDRRKGDPISLFIYFYQTERQPKPVLIGFNREEEKEFFQQFISVEDIGPLKAVKAMTIPIGDIAGAIESGDAAKLMKLKGIGKRTAQKIIAALEGKMGKFVSSETPAMVRDSDLEDTIRQVLDVLVSQLGHKSQEARQMIKEALERNDAISSPEDLFDEIYRGGEAEK